MPDGGRRAGFGLRYQYLASAEQILSFLVEHADDVGAISLTVEPTAVDIAGGGVDEDAEVIDYRITIDATPVERTQVKSSRNPSPDNPVGLAAAKKIFTRMGPAAPRGNLPRILTNRPLTQQLRELCGTSISTTAHTSTYELITADGLHGLITHDHRSVAEVKEALLQRIQQIRSDQALGPGLRSAGLLMPNLVDTIADAAAGMSPNTLSGTDILQLLYTPDHDLSHAMRRRDWGTPLLEVPRLVSAVPRVEKLGELTEVFNTSVAGGTPTVVVLCGVTGFGKSTIAADFCHLYRHLYEHVIWVDSRQEPLIEAKVKDTLAQMGIVVEPESDVAALFRTAMGTIGGPFVVVFDGAANRTHIERFVPTSGTGLTIVTTPSTTRWWAGAYPIPVEGFTVEQGVRCFARYAGVEEDQHRGAIEDIVKRLQRVPLAIAMAGLYFHDSGQDVTNLSASYLDGLSALDVQANIPEGFDRTAFAAVQLAVTRLAEGRAGTDEEHRRAQELIHRSALLAAELIPFSLILQTLAGVDHADPTSPPRPAVADARTRDVIMATLQTQTIARRRQYVDSAGTQNPASDTLNMHPLVHEILQTIQLRTDPATLIGPLTDLLACVYGWLEQMRHEGQFFPVDQLLVHSDALLQIVDGLDVSDAAASDQHDYRCSHVLLRSEAANAYSSRGQYGRSVAMTERALQDISGLQVSPRARALIAKAAADAVTDVHLGGLGIDRALPLAHRLMDELHILETTDAPEAGEWTYLSADLGARALMTFDSAQAQDTIRELYDIAGRQQRRPSLTGALQRIVDDIKAGRLQAALETVTVAVARPEAQTTLDQATLRQMGATALLHLHRFGQAADNIEYILNADPYPHLAEPFKRLYIALNTGLNYEAANWRTSTAGPRLSALHVEITTRLNRCPTADP
jgi:tetratricopeptide (TPR) repeat protein